MRSLHSCMLSMYLCTTVVHVVCCLICTVVCCLIFTVVVALLYLGGSWTVTDHLCAYGFNWPEPLGRFLTFQLKPKRVLEFGCGLGLTADYLGDFLVCCLGCRMLLECCPSALQCSHRLFQCCLELFQCCGGCWRAVIGCSSVFQAD